MTRAKDISKIITDADFSGTLDVTGDLTVDTNTLYVDSTNNNVGIGTSSPIRQLSLQNSSNAEISLVSGTSSNCSLLMGDGTSGTDFYRGYIQYQNSNDAMLFATSTGERMRIDSSGKVGIGTSSPTGKLEINGSDGALFAMRTTGDTANQVMGTQYLNNSGAITAQTFATGDSSSSSVFRIKAIGAIDLIGGDIGVTGASPDLRIASDGNVSIGTSSGTGRLSIDGTGTGSTTVLKVNNTDSATFVHAQQNIAPNLASGNTVIDFVGKELSTKNSGYIGYTWAGAGSNSNRLTFGHFGSDYLMNLTADGNLLVGKTSLGLANDGGEVRADGQISATKSGAVPAVFNRKTDDGEVINLRQDSTTIGGIYSSPSITGPFIGHINVGLAMYHNGDSVLPSGTGGLRDNAIDLGNASNRFDDIYATNSTIQTSDRNEKQDIEELSDAEQRVAVVAKGLMRKFRWIDSVAEKGDNARTHFGIIAQDLQDAFTAEGLDAGDYAMFTSTTWWEKEISVDAVEADEENGIEAQDAYTYKKIAEEATDGYTEKTRLGVRYNQLLAFIISAI